MPPNLASIVLSGACLAGCRSAVTLAPSAVPEEFNWLIIVAHPGAAELVWRKMGKGIIDATE